MKKLIDSYNVLSAACCAALFAFLLMPSLMADDSLVSNALIRIEATNASATENGTIESVASNEGMVLLTVPEGGGAPVLLQSGIGNLPSIQFDGASTLSGPIPVVIPTSRSFVIVANIQSGSSNGQIPIATMGYHSGLALTKSGTGERLNVVHYGPSTASANPDLTPEALSEEVGKLFTEEGLFTDAIFIVVYREPGVEVYLNGKQIISSDLTAAFEVAANNLALTLGGMFAGEQLVSINGLISEVLLYDRPLEPEERTEIEKALSEKYGISLE